MNFTLRVFLGLFVAHACFCWGSVGEEVEWVALPGGEFKMGTDDGGPFFKDAKPVHAVTIKDFEMSKTLVTVEQYGECVIKGKCTKPQSGYACNWGKKDRRRHPVNCVDWDQANQYAKFKGARLPSESEWEYAATSGGRDQKYPWGNEDATCERAVMHGGGGLGCGSKGTMPVCSKPRGNTAQGLCDMAGNVWQWVQDKYQNSYANAPTDGRAVEAEGSGRVARGGSFFDTVVVILRADCRRRGVVTSRNFSSFGFRLAR